MRTTRSNAIKGSLSLDHNHVIPLDFESHRKLPKSHAWSIRPVTNPSTETIPIIDLQHPNSKQLIKQACKNLGVFQIMNHGVPISLLEQVEEQTRRLFALPTRQKIRALRSDNELTGYGVARIGQFFPKKMWSEGFTMAGSPKDHVRRLWPCDYTTFCDAMEDYQNKMSTLSDKILGLMLESLGLHHEDLKWAKPIPESKHTHAMLQLNSYPSCPDPTRAMGLAPHTDSSLFTLLYQSNTNGLQVHDDNGSWVTVPLVPGALIVNSGDLIHIISNGLFKTVLHRAIVNKAQHRISVAYFLGAPKDVKISPLIKLVDDDHPILYRPVTWKEYLDLKAAYFDNALDYIRMVQDPSSANLLSRTKISKM